MSVRRSLIILTLLVFAVPPLVFAQRAAQQQQTQPPSANLQEYVVTRGSVQVTVNAVGTIQADQVAQLTFAGTGRITELPFEIGAQVTAGDVLARLNPTTQQNAVEQANVSLQMALLQRERLLQGPSEAQIEAARAQVVSAVGQAEAIENGVTPEQIRAAELAVQQAEQGLRDAQQWTITAGGRGEIAYQQALAQEGQASFNVEIARQNLQSLLGSNEEAANAAWARVGQAQAELDRLRAGPTDAELSQADAQIAQAQIGLEQAQVALERTNLTAPFDGLITAVNAEVGGLTTAGLPVLELTDTDPLRLTVLVDEIDVRQIAEGMPATITVDALPEVELPATIEQIGLVATSDEGVISYEVRVRLDGIDPRVRIGMTAEAAIVVDARDDVLLVPNAYIRLDRLREQAFVNLVRPGGVLEEVEVTLGLQGQENSEVVSGLSAGDVIAIDLSGSDLNLFGG